MSLTFNGTEVKEIIYNGTALNQVDNNGVTVFKKDDWSDKPYVAFIEENGKQFFLWRIRTDTKATYSSTIWDGLIEYSIDGETWTVWKNQSTINSSNDGKLFVRGSNNTYLVKALISDNYIISSWRLSGARKIKCFGNIENLLDYTKVAQGEHPKMAMLCYNYMFNGCTSLTQAPELPATTLAYSCYSSMFSGCTSLTGQIHLPASVSSNSDRLKDTDITGSSATIVFDL